MMNQEQKVIRAKVDSLALDREKLLLGADLRTEA